MDDKKHVDRHGQTGQALPLVVAAMALVTVVLLGVVRLGIAAAELARARTAADAAALAGAAQGRGAAERLARTNGARLAAFRTAGTDVVVTVVVGRMRATARARATSGVASPADHLPRGTIP